MSTRSPGCTTPSPPSPSASDRIPSIVGRPYGDLAKSSDFRTMEPWILLTGAAGYIGGRLLRLLEVEGRPVRGIAHAVEHPPGKI